MPQIMRYQQDRISVTVTADTAYAIVLQPYAKRINVSPAANAGEFSYDEADKATMSAYYQPIPADSLYTESVPKDQERALARRAVILELAAQPTAGELYTINDGTTSVIFGFDSGGDVQVTIGANKEETAATWAADISSSGLVYEADQGLRNTAQVHMVANAAGATFTGVDGTADGDVTATDLGDEGAVAYVTSAVEATVIHVSSELRDSGK